jgi:hypothetical protein
VGLSRGGSKQNCRKALDTTALTQVFEGILAPTPATGVQFTCRHPRYSGHFVCQSVCFLWWDNPAAIRRANHA